MMIIEDAIMIHLKRKYMLIAVVILIIILSSIIVILNNLSLDTRKESNLRGLFFVNDWSGGQPIKLDANIEAGFRKFVSQKPIKADKGLMAYSPAHLLLDGEKYSLWDDGIFQIRKSIFNSDQFLWIDESIDFGQIIEDIQTKSTVMFDPNVKLNIFAKYHNP